MSAADSLPVCQVIVVVPVSVPPGTGLGAARRTTPTSLALFSDAGGTGAAESGEDGRPQPMTKRPASIRQSAVPREIVLANSSFLFVTMIELIMLLAPRNNFFSGHAYLLSKTIRLG